MERTRRWTTRIPDARRHRMDDEMTQPARTPRFLDEVEDSASLAMGAKVQVWGGPETGKSHDAYENLPRPLIVLDSDVSAGL